MKIQFESAEDFDLLVETIKSGILYWKKVKQDAQGKICLQCSGEMTHYTVEEADDKIEDLLRLLMTVECTPHLDWNGRDYVMTEEGEPKYYSSMVENNKGYLKG